MYHDNPYYIDKVENLSTISTGIQSAFMPEFLVYVVIAATLIAVVSFFTLKRELS